MLNRIVLNDQCVNEIPQTQTIHSIILSTKTSNDDEAGGNNQRSKGLFDKLGGDLQ